jgi:hypothetical protein
MTPDERKTLGINKSTLWYIKKNLSEGKTPKIYPKILLKISILNNTRLNPLRDLNPSLNNNLIH